MSVQLPSIATFDVLPGYQLYDLLETWQTEQISIAINTYNTLQEFQNDMVTLLTDIKNLLGGTLDVNVTNTVTVNNNGTFAP